MKQLLKNSFILIFTAGFLVSCSESRRQATEKLNELNERAAELNSAVDDGLKTIESFDSVVRTGAEQLKEYDSLIINSSSKIDSIAREKAEAWEELTTF